MCIRDRVFERMGMKEEECVLTEDGLDAVIKRHENTSCTVSYTHLDVYKRQALMSAGWTKGRNSGGLTERRPKDAF